MNKPQAERKVHLRQYSRTQEKKVQHYSAIKKILHMLVYLESFLLIIMVELYDRRSAAKTLVNKMQLNT